MIRIILITFMFIIPSVIINASESNKTHVLHFEFKGGAEEARKLDMETINEYVSLLKEKKDIPLMKDLMLRRVIVRLYEEHIQGKDTTARMELVKRRLTTNIYNILEGHFLKLLKNGSLSKKQLAADVLGRGLFSTNSIGLLKEYVFQDQPVMQFEAIVDLTYLDVKGANNILKKYILSGLLSSASELTALSALKAVGDKDLKPMAFFIASNEKTDAYDVRRCLELLREQDGYLEYVEGLFLSNRFPFSSSLKLSDNEDDNNGLTRYLVEELYKNGKNIKDKTNVFAKARRLVQTPHRGLYIYAAFLLFKFGDDEDRKFIASVANQSDSNPDKIKFLNALLKGGIPLEERSVKQSQSTNKTENLTNE